jgi:hypothetical protein
MALGGVMPGINASELDAIFRGGERCRKKSQWWNSQLCKAGIWFALTLGLFGFGQIAVAQVNSNTQSITLNATLAETLTIAASPSTVSFTLVAGGTAVGTPTVNVTTTWVLGSRTAVNLYGYFASTTAALTGTGGNIPTSEVLGSVNAGTYNAFTATTALGTAGASLGLFTQTITSANKSSNRSDTLTLEINLTAQPQLPAGTYTGTLTLQAQAT